MQKVTCKEVRAMMLKEWQRFSNMTVEQTEKYIKYNYVCSNYTIKKLAREFSK